MTNRELMSRIGNMLKWTEAKTFNEPPKKVEEMEAKVIEEIHDLIQARYKEVLAEIHKGRS
jgi:hypothetical protein